jgi:alpha-L-fucosidase
VVQGGRGHSDSQYEILAKHFHPKPNAARDWARLAKKAGQKYMVMTTKHHEGFCHWDSKLTDYNAVKQGPGRDLVANMLKRRAPKDCASASTTR